MNKDPDSYIEQLQHSYDDIPYFESNAFTPSDPRNLAECAANHGLTPPDPQHSRILELACGCGGNLVSLASLLPHSEFLGIDLSEKQIALARDLAIQADVQNVQFSSGNILDIYDDLGTFDYIIVHGVFSWIPENVQEKVLEVCSSHLARNGLAMISYMVYPGGSIADTLRDIMHIHLKDIVAPYDRLEKGRELLALLAESGHSRPHPMSKVYSDVHTATINDARVFYHEYLNVKTDTFYFEDIALRAAKWKLSYVDDAFRTPDYAIDNRIMDRLHAIANNRVHREQYLDYLVNRTSRNSIFCKESSLTEELENSFIKDRYICSCLKPNKPGVQLDTAAPDQFFLNASHGTTVSKPMHKNALAILHQEWPKGLFYTELLSRLSIQTRSELTNNDEDMLANFLLESYSLGLLELRLSPPNCINHVSAKPVVSKLVRFQAMHNSHVTNQRHANISIGALGKLLLPLLDGANDLNYLVERMEQSIGDGSLVLPDSTGTPEERIKRALDYYRWASLLLA